MSDNKSVAKTNAKSIQDYLYNDSSLKAFSEVATQGMDVSKAVKIAWNAISKNSTLLKCEPRSFLFAMKQAMTDGLIVDGMSNEAHFVPMWNSDKRCYEVVYIRGYKGLTKLSKRADESIRDIYACLVYEGDYFEMEEGYNPNLKHSINPKSDRSEDNIIGGYCIVVHKDGYRRAIYMSRYDIDKIKDQVIERTEKSGKVKYKGPWINNYEEQCKKTLIRRMNKSLDLPTEGMEIMQGHSGSMACTPLDDEIDVKPSIEGDYEKDKTEEKVVTQEDLESDFEAANSALGE